MKGLGGKEGQSRQRLLGSQWGVEDFTFAEEGSLANDGSAVHTRWKHLARAGWAVVQWDKTIGGIRAIFGPL